ncbi:alkaline phosphatase family protein [Myxococcota bacterium]|nr:alkaline phosphatase family protein [Myxococcota bacterium]
MRRTVVLGIPGLMASSIGDHTPHLAALARAGGTRLVTPVLPAVAPAVEATFLTGVEPRVHGCVGSGWYARELGALVVDRPSSRLVDGERIWEAARRVDPAFTSATIFWSHGMYGTSDFSVCLRPGDEQELYAQPAALGAELVKALGPMPVHALWGPGASVEASRWIGRAARLVYETRQPTLTMVGLPHLDRELQRLGPDHPDVGRALDAIDQVAGELVERARRDGSRVIVVSPHGMSPVSAPVHLNRALGRAQLLSLRDVGGAELLDVGASDAFAVADRQVAHVYVRAPEQVPAVKALLEATEGVDRVLDREGLRAAGLDHPRSGELFAIAAADRWFSHAWWSDDAVAPRRARTVGWSGKVGHDPAELFVDPMLVAPRLRLVVKTWLRRLGFDAAVDVVPLGGNLVRGSYGRVSADAVSSPVVVSSDAELLPAETVDAKAFKRLVLDHLFDAPKKVKRPVVEAHHLQLLSAAAAIEARPEPAKNGKHAHDAYLEQGTAME